MLPRFYAPDVDGERAEQIVMLSEEESAHLLRVLRLSRGDGVRVFDGRGREWEGEVAETTQKTVRVKLLHWVRAAPEPAVPVLLAVAVLKSDKMDDVVRDAVMLGVASVRPLLTDRAEAGSTASGRARRLERWRRIAVASAKQCGRARVPTIEAFATFNAAITEKTRGARLVFVEPRWHVATARLQDIGRPERATLFIGPEGGWSDGELRAAQQSGASLVTMGGITLRADRMPVVALTAVKTLWEDF